MLILLIVYCLRHEFNYADFIYHDCHLLHSGNLFFSQILMNRAVESGSVLTLSEVRLSGNSRLWASLCLH